MIFKGICCYLIILFLYFDQRIHFCSFLLANSFILINLDHGNAAVRLTDAWESCFTQKTASVFFFPKSWLCKKQTQWLSRNQCSRVQCPHFLIGACSNHYIIWLEWEKNSYWAQKKKQTSLVSTVNLSHWAATNKAWCPCFEMKRIWSTTCKHLHFTVQPLECHFVCWWMQ